VPHPDQRPHFPFGPDIEEHTPAQGPSFLVATGPRAFDGGTILAAYRFMPGVVQTTTKFATRCLQVLSKNEFLPPGTEVAPPG
jgi:hypothetical protein